MTKVWDKFVPLSRTVIDKFRLDDSIAEIELSKEYEYVGHDFSWKNYMFQSNKFRRAHIEIVDAMLTKNMWIMHMTISLGTNQGNCQIGQKQFLVQICLPQEISARMMNWINWHIFL